MKLNVTSADSNPQFIPLFRSGDGLHEVNDGRFLIRDGEDCILFGRDGTTHFIPTADLHGLPVRKGGPITIANPEESA